MVLQNYLSQFRCINITTTEYLMRRSASTTRVTPMSCTNNIPVALLVLHSSLNVWLTFVVVCLDADYSPTFRHFQVLFDRQTGWIFSSLDISPVAFNAVFIKIIV